MLCNLSDCLTQIREHVLDNNYLFISMYINSILTLISHYRVILNLHDHIPQLLFL